MYSIKMLNTNLQKNYNNFILGGSFRTYADVEDTNSILFLRKCFEVIAIIKSEMETRFLKE